MNPNRKIPVSGDLLSKKTEEKEGVSSARPMKHLRQSGDSSATAVSGVSSSKKQHGKAVVGSDVPSATADEVMLFRDVAFGPQNGELRFRLVHFWEARKPISKILIGLEMLLIDGEGTVMQGYIPPARINTYLRHMTPGSTYRLNNYCGSKNKTGYRVAEPDVTISFTCNSVLSDLTDSTIQFPEDRFSFHGYEEFEAGCDLGGDLYDFIGHIKLVNEQIPKEIFVLDEVEIASTRRILIHVQTHDGPVMNLYLWDKAATDFCAKFKALGKAPTVILATTVNPKCFGGALALSTLASSRVFLDMDVESTREYLAWYETNMEVANRVKAEVVTKAETATIQELFSYMQQAEAKVAWFECTATIDDFERGTAWYYIACGGCKTKATKGSNTLMCKKCGKTDIAGTAEYLTKLSVYDDNDQASFVLLGNAGRDLTGMKASKLVETYYEANDSVGDGDFAPVPQALIDAIGQTRPFVIKVSKHNLEGKTQTLTVTKVLAPEVPPLEGDLEENVVVPPAAETLQLGNQGEGASTDTVAEEAKAAKSG